MCARVNKETAHAQDDSTPFTYPDTLRSLPDSTTPNSSPAGSTANKRKDEYLPDIGSDRATVEGKRAIETDLGTADLSHLASVLILIAKMRTSSVRAPSKELHTVDTG